MNYFEEEEAFPKIRKPGEKISEWAARQSPSQKYLHLFLGTTLGGALTLETDEEYLEELLESSEKILHGLNILNFMKILILTAMIVHRY